MKWMHSNDDLHRGISHIDEQWIRILHKSERNFLFKFLSQVENLPFRYSEKARRFVPDLKIVLMVENI